MIRNKQHCPRIQMLTMKEEERIRYEHSLLEPMERNSARRSSAETLQEDIAAMGLGKLENSVQ